MVGLDGVQEITLTYEIGVQTANLFKYTVYLIQVAQYTIQYDPGATGAIVYIQDHYPTRTSTPTQGVPAISGGPTANSYQADGQQELNNTTHTQRTGNVGKDSSSGTYDKEVFVVISTNRPGVIVSVTNSSGNFVTNVLDSSNQIMTKATANAQPSPLNPLLSDVTSNKDGAFYPDSRKYTIRVRPTTPPTGLSVGSSPQD